jgi:hypothetical protein
MAFETERLTMAGGKLFYFSPKTAKIFDLEKNIWQDWIAFKDHLTFNWNTHQDPMLQNFLSVIY